MLFLFDLKKGEIAKPSMRFFISSAKLNAAEFDHAARTHWSIEIKLHWKIDTAFNEDFSRIRRENAAENMAMVRHTAINLLAKEKTFKASTRRKLKKANRNVEYIEKVLIGQDLS